LGLPRPAGGSGCAGARRSARPIGGFAASVWPAATPYHPSACGGFAACPIQMDQN